MPCRLFSTGSLEISLKVRKLLGGPRRMQICPPLIESGFPITLPKRIIPLCACQIPRCPKHRVEARASDAVLCALPEGERIALLSEEIREIRPLHIGITTEGGGRDKIAVAPCRSSLLVLVPEQSVIMVTVEYGVSLECPRWSP